MAQNGNAGLVDRATMRSVISLLDWVYRLGVSDAHAEAVDGPIREFCGKTSQAGVFGFLTDEYTITWKEWSLRLCAKARMTSWNGPLTRLFQRIGRYGTNYLSVFLNIAQCYYNKGLMDYMKAGSADISQLSKETRVLLTKDGRLRRCKTREYIETIQLMSFDLERRDTAIWESSANEPAAKRQGALRPKHYHYWRSAIRLAMPEMAGL